MIDSYHVNCQMHQRDMKIRSILSLVKTIALFRNDEKRVILDNMKSTIGSVPSSG